MKIFINNTRTKVLPCLLFLLFINIFVVSCTYKSGLNSSAQDADGNLIHLSDYRGKWIVLNYWASWCGHCQAEIPELNAFYQAHNQKDAVVLAVNIDQTDNQQLPQVIKQLNINYPVLAYPGPAIGIHEIPGIPTSFLINPHGQLVETIFGELTKQKLEKEMNLSSDG